MPSSPKYAQAEIERRWLVPVSVASSLMAERVRHIEDHYFHDTALRLRIVRETGRETLFKLGKKYEKTGLVQPSVSIYLSATEAAVLARLPARIAIKKRLSLAGGALDIYSSPAHDFAIFEIDYPHAGQALADTPPAFVSQEVTGMAEYSGHALAADTA